LALAVASVAALGPGRSALADAQTIGPDDRTIGPEDAPITIIEYASMTCPHCARFHQDTYPDLKAQWIDNGKARYVFRHFPLDGLALRASALSECMEGERFFGFLDLLFSSQQTWARASDPIATLQDLAKQAGLDEEASGACLSDDVTITRVLTQRKEAADEFDINSTPSFVINGQTVKGGLSLEEFNEYLNGLL
jgi:protein-disulfide isomerase